MSARTDYRRHILLALVVQQTERDTAGHLTRFFVPSVDGHWLEGLKDRVYIGMDDESTLREIEQLGLIERRYPTATGARSYHYAATEDGVLADRIYNAEEFSEDLLPAD